MGDPSAPRPLPSLFGPLRFSHPPPHIPKHSWVSPRTPRGGAPYIPGSRTPPPLPWDGVGTTERALPLLLKGGAAGPLRAPSPTSPLLKDNKGG